MYIMGIQGGYGTGKTLTSVVKAHQWAASTGAKLFANFPLRDAYLFDHYTDWYSVADVHGSIIIFDESQTNFDSRNWGSNGQTIMTQVMNYVRKLNALLIFVLPSYQNVDTRIRQMTGILVDCQKSRSGTIYNYVYDFQKKEFGDRGQLINRWTLTKAAQKDVHALQLYSTHSMVHKFPTPPPNKVDAFFKELDKRHQSALERHYGKQYLSIETLSKEELKVHEYVG